MKKEQLLFPPVSAVIFISGKKNIIYYYFSVTV